MVRNISYPIWLQVQQKQSSSSSASTSTEVCLTLLLAFAYAINLFVSASGTPSAMIATTLIVDCFRASMEEANALQVRQTSRRNSNHQHNTVLCRTHCQRQSLLAPAKGCEVDEDIGRRMGLAPCTNAGKQETQALPSGAWVTFRSTSIQIHSLDSMTKKTGLT